MHEFVIFVALIAVLVAGFHSRGPATRFGRLGLVLGLVLVAVVILVVAARFEGGL